MALLTVHLNKRQKADNIVCQSASCMNVDYINMSRLVQAIDGCKLLMAYLVQKKTSHALAAHQYLAGR